MIKKYADARGVKAYKLRDYKTIEIDDKGVEGYCSYLHTDEYIISDEGEETYYTTRVHLQFFRKAGDYCFTATYENDESFRDFYIDITDGIGLTEDNVPYHNDLYLDMIVRSKDDFEVLDEDELKEAYEKNDITKEQFNRAYEILNFLKSSFLSNLDSYKELADKYYKFLQK